MIYLELFLTFLKLGAFTFGGGAAMMPFIQEEAVSKWGFTPEEIINFIAISESTPGPFAVNIATFVGAEKGGFFGSVCATFGLVLPSFIIILIIAKCYEKFKTNKLVAGAMTGLRPTSVGLIAAATVSIGVEIFFPAGFSFAAMLSYEFIAALVIFAGMLTLCLVKKKTSPILVIGISALIGIAVGYGGNLLGFSII
ncbi:MAG: chromate transporter [Clostridia bacterium]|nr:chromate transporter [Clostridia bacterium]